MLVPGFCVDCIMFELREKVVVAEQRKKMLYKSNSLDIMSMTIFFF